MYQDCTAVTTIIKISCVPLHGYNAQSTLVLLYNPLLFCFDNKIGSNLPT